MCRHLARYHHSFVRRGRQQKDDLDTILEELAEWFLRWTGQNRKTIDDVPYSINSRFITFVVEALEPIGMYFEVSAKALSRRWERRVRHARTGWPRAETAEAFGDDA
jgi:hypothetical protein